MWKRALLSILILAGLSPLTFALAENPPADLDDTLEMMVTKGYSASFTARGWGSVYDLPQSQFSIDDTDFFDNQNEFGKIGLYAVGLNTLLNPQLDGLDLNEGIADNITHAAASTLAWVWTPDTVSFGVKHKGKLPNNGITNVLPKVTGISVTSNACLKDAEILYNTWGVPKDTINKQTSSQLNSLAGIGYLYAEAAQHTTNETTKKDYETIAKGIGDMLLTAIVTPEDESFGINSSKTADSYGHTIPTGMIPAQFTISTDSVDTELCTDGGSIKLQENRKTHIAQTIVFWRKLSEITGEQKYSRAADIAEEGILSIQECDGSYKDYTRWEGAGINPNTCTPDDGSESYEAYPAYVAVAETKGFLTDMGIMLHLLQKSNPTIYQTNDHFKKAVQYLLVLEEEDTAGAGQSYNGDPLRYASYSIDVENRSFAQTMLGSIFLRASCVETDTAMEKRLQQRAYDLLDTASNLVPSELDSKVANAIATDPGTNILAASAAADSWKIITSGCEDCKDKDGDGYLDGECAGDTVKYDCNDNDAAIHPNATETCDSIDNDCDGKIDDGYDADNDGYAICGEKIDCNDASNEVYPGAKETKDGADNDCNGKIDDAGIEFQLITDVNTGVSNIEVVLIEYGNVCANSFSSLASSITKIKEQCATAGTCTTDESGKCLFTLDKDGSYQALANLPKKGVVSDKIDYETEERVPYVLFVGNVDVNANDINATTTKPNPFTNNPYFFGGFALVGIIIAGGVLFYLYKTGKLKIPTLNTKTSGMTPNASRGETKTNTSNAPASKPFKMNITLPRIQLPTLVKPSAKKEEDARTMLYSGKMSTGQKIASKIVGGNPIGGKWENKLGKKPLNFAKKENKARVWKDD